MMSQTNLMALLHDSSQLGNAPTSSTKVKSSGQKICITYMVRTQLYI